MTLTETSRRSRRSIGAIALSALLVLTLTGAGSTGSPAGASLLPAGALAPAERQHFLARQVGGMLEEDHYSGTSIDDRMSRQIYDHYVDSLDSQRSYFLASDVAEFSKDRDHFDDMIHSGTIEPGFAMYARLQQRNRERIEYALSLLKTEPDFTVDESFEFDRSKMPWPATTQEMNELWRKRVKSDALSLMLTGKNWADSAAVLKKRYEHSLQRASKVTADEVFENLMNAYARSYDPHSNFFSPRNSEEYKIQMSLSYEGIGATLQQSDDEFASIVNLVPGGPAAIANTLGIKDRITAIGQDKDGPFEDVIGWRLDDVVQLIRGKGGTLVRLQILPAGAAPGSPEKVIELTRGKITLENQAAKKERRLVTRNGRKLNIGVINVPSFYRDTDEESKGEEDYRSTTRDVARLIRELKNEGQLDGLILDLRGDGGGFLPEAQALVGLFIDKGPVVQLKNSSGQVEVLDDPIPGVVYDGPLVVLIDRTSASASEIFAGAIQDYGRGYVVGQRSFGKGTVQQLFMLDRWTQKPKDGQLTVTIGKFYRVTGESTQHRGVEPDIQLPSPIDMNEVGESSLDAALPWDRIAPASFQRYREPRPIPTAAALSHGETERDATDPNFQWLVKSLAVSDKLRDQKSLSLNLAKRKAERVSQDAERLRLDNERRKALGKPLFATLEEMEKSNSDGDAAALLASDPKKQLAPDDKIKVTNRDNGVDEILLDRTTQIMADIVSGIEPAAASRALAQREAKPEAASTEARVK